MIKKFENYVVAAQRADFSWDQLALFTNKSDANRYASEQQVACSVFTRSQFRLEVANDGYRYKAFIFVDLDTSGLSPAEVQDAITGSECYCYHRTDSITSIAIQGNSLALGDRNTYKGWAAFVQDFSHKDPQSIWLVKIDGDATIYEIEDV